jgi:hypothetical protein
MMAFLVATGSYLLPIIFSCVIYVALICRKRKNFENKIECFDDEIIHSEHPKFGMMVSENYTREPTDLIINKDAVVFKTTNGDIDEITGMNPEDVIENSSLNFVPCQVTEELTNRVQNEANEESTSVEDSIIVMKNSVENALNHQLQNEESLPETTSSLESANGIKTNHKNPVEKNLKEQQTPKPPLNTNTSSIIFVKDIQW